MFRDKLIIALTAALLTAANGCSLVLPKVAQEPVIRNPFPQLSRVAVAPFFNQSDEPTVDGRQVAMAYFAELQQTPGFEVVPLGVVEEAIIEHRIDLSGPNEARRLAQILGVDAVAVGSVTDFSEYYPPRMGLRVEWYTANMGFHEIPAGYGLPWNTPEEEFIPDRLVYESQMALARDQMRGATPDCDGQCLALPAPPAAPAEGGAPAPAAPQAPVQPATPTPAASGVESARRARSTELVVVSAQEELPAGQALESGGAGRAGAGDATAAPAVTSEPAPLAQVFGAETCNAAPCLMAPLQAAGPPPCVPHYGPVLSHTRLYTGNDADVTEALEGYVFFRDDLRYGGWKSYLNRSDDFIRFCCHMHISEMLSARGGSRKTQVVWRWPESR